MIPSTKGTNMSLKIEPSYNDSANEKDDFKNFKN